jgi:hypothetical protein
MENILGQDEIDNLISSYNNPKQQTNTFQPSVYHSNNKEQPIYRCIPYYYTIQYGSGETYGAVRYNYEKYNSNNREWEFAFYSEKMLNKIN